MKRFINLLKIKKNTYQNLTFVASKELFNLISILFTNLIPKKLP